MKILCINKKPKIEPKHPNAKYYHLSVDDLLRMFLLKSNNIPPMVSVNIGSRIKPIIWTSPYSYGSEEIKKVYIRKIIRRTSKKNKKN